MLVNFVGFNAGWFGCVLAAAAGLPWAGPVGVAALAALHLWMTPDRRRELGLLAAVAVLGTVIDSVQMKLGVFSFPGAAAGATVCPLWLSAMWVNFALTLHVSGSWLRGRYAVAAALGAVAGPASYCAGARMGAMRLHPDPAVALPALVFEWSLAMPLLLKAAAWTEPRPGERCS